MWIPILPLVLAFISSIWSLLKDRETRGVVAVVFFVLLSGMFFYHFAEGWTWLDSLYFSVTTLTTVGFGDLSPKTDLGKLFTIVYILTGLSILAGFLTLLAQKQNERNQRTRERRRSRAADKAGQKQAATADDAEDIDKTDSL